MLATIPATFALSRIAIFDMVFTTFLFGSVGCLLVASTERRPRLEWCGYGLLALAIMTKGPVALVVVGLFIITARLVPGDARAQVKWLHWKTGSARRRDRGVAVVSLDVVAFWPGVHSGLRPRRQSLVLHPARAVLGARDRSRVLCPHVRRRVLSVEPHRRRPRVRRHQDLADRPAARTAARRCCGSGCSW